MERKSFNISFDVSTRSKAYYLGQELGINSLNFLLIYLIDTEFKKREGELKNKYGILFNIKT